ncbi:hypothetical protein CW706_05870 [Candidatus Bathyarchaeota archaeon]|nr:MAG: hypothetical protein CW706_05870 [Candidatus Bathyarchaeota archaeon]
MRIFKSVERDMEAANIRLHPEVYLSIVGFLTFLTSLFSFSFFLLWFLEILPLKIPILVFLVLVLPPPITLTLGVLIPRLIASNKISGLKNEIPYASMYLSVMTSGGLSPYASLLRLRNTDLLPRLKEEINRIIRVTLSTGIDPVSALAKAAKDLKLKEYSQLLLGYASTTKTGGDVLHYLYSQTESMFRRMALRIKVMGDRMSLLMEGYTIIAILGALGIYVMFIISLSFPKFQALPPEIFFFFSFILLPSISVLFLYLTETMQINYPISQWETYLALLGSIPLGVFMMLQMVIPYFVDVFPHIPVLSRIPMFLREMLALREGCEPALGLAISLIVVSLPVIVSDRVFSEEEKGILDGMTRFLRDLVENRKTGLSPEKSIQLLAERDYGKFSKYLRLMSAEISWGIPLRKIFRDFRNRVKNWICLINLYLLIDTIEAGGGTERSLETLAEFAEETKNLEYERRARLIPLFIVPYMGAVILTLTTTMLLQLFTSMSSASGVQIAVKNLTETLITPLILHSFTLGIVSGKIVSGRISAGFKHAFLLIMLSIVGIYVATHIL